MANFREGLRVAKVNKQDEFYTTKDTIEAELPFYRQWFENKIVYLNCDSEKSEFFNFFLKNFYLYKLKKLIATSYNNNGYGVLLKKERDNLFYDKIILKGDGDFNSEECIELLEESDVIVTNPPFSLWRKFIHTIIEHNKNFIILGTLNAASYKFVFTEIINNKIRLGYGKQHTTHWFTVPESYELRTSKSKQKNNKTLLPVGGVCWFTNIFMDNNSCNQFNFTSESPVYNKEYYQEYLNYPAINVDKIKDIPKDYYGLMGVPLTYLCVHNPSLFRITGSNSYNGDELLQSNLFYINMHGKEIFTKKAGNAVFVKIDKEHSKDDKLYYDKNGNYYKAPYARIFIQRI